MPFQSFSRIAIFGSADIPESHELYIQARQIAATLAAQGVEIVNGGGPGVMKAATVGAHEAGGKVHTISFAPTDAPFFEGKDSGNHGDRETVAQTYPERLHMLLDASDAFVIMNGGTGTLSEWAAVWLMAHIYYGKHKPFVLVGEFWQPMIDSIKHYMFIDGAEMLVFRIVHTVDEVLPALQELEAELLALPPIK